MHQFGALVEKGAHLKQGEIVSHRKDISVVGREGWKRGGKGDRRKR